jgi:phenylacetate-CoA ligase
VSARFPPRLRGDRNFARERDLAADSSFEIALSEMRSTVRNGFGVPVGDGFGSTEGLVGKTCPDDDVFVFNTDLCIVELVDNLNRPVAPGSPAAKVLVTNLYNLTQPLITTTRSMSTPL